MSETDGLDRQSPERPLVPPDCPVPPDTFPMVLSRHEMEMFRDKLTEELAAVRKGIVSIEARLAALPPDETG